MTWLIGLAAVMISLCTVLTIHPFENDVINAICFSLLFAAHTTLVCIAEHFEDKLEKRIETLEKKLEDKDKEKGGE